MDIKITQREALARLSDADPIEVRWQALPNSGVTRWNKIPHADAVALIQTTSTLFEAGPQAQRMDFGVYALGASHDLPLAAIFFQTKPECRLTDEQLAESRLRGHGADIFSGADAPIQRT